ncbi:PorT family protein [Segetibacter sp. 3557_3]|uniref:porin family protein n=1 Tax=Segetibacter sp. 3557_3 TaxID=2547429 RepID=UPI001058DB3A|nr:porin family protein [Segetibacter sp. 3557_3]TDH23056.1 PorT family protein [Segetibacter sp. 3557_3]
MKKIVLVFVVFVLSNTLASAQDWRVGLKAGLSIPKLRASSDDEAFSSGYRTILGPQAGLLAEYRFNDLFSIQTEVNYSAQGGKKSGKQKVRTSIFAAMVPVGLNLPEYLYANFNSEVALSYLEVPVLAKFSFSTSSLSRLSVYGGPFVGYLLEATGKSAGKSRIYTDGAQTTEFTIPVGGVPVAVGVQDLTMKQDITEQCNRTNYGLQGGISYAYTFSRFEVFAAAGGTYGFRYLQKNADLGTNKTGGAFANIGATISL